MSAARTAAIITPALIMNKIRNSFDALGRRNGTAAPPSSDNREQYAWEFHVASELSKAAEARKKAATTAAVQAGVLIDPLVEPREPGTNEVLFSGENVQVQVSVRNATTNYNIDAIRSSLISQGVSPTLVENAITDGMRYNRAPHSFKTLLLSNRAPVNT